MTKFGKVWGETRPLLVTPTVEIHRIDATGGFRCSEHLHRFKWNGFYCVRGELWIHVRKNDYDLVDITKLYPGEFTTVAPNEYHWFSVPKSEIYDDNDELIYESSVRALEIYYPQHISEDIIRKTVGGLNE